MRLLNTTPMAVQPRIANGRSMTAQLVKCMASRLTWVSTLRLTVLNFIVQTIVFKLRAQPSYELNKYLCSYSSLLLGGC